jgi:RHS repeat-associated protein
LVAALATAIATPPSRQRVAPPLGKVALVDQAGPWTQVTSIGSINLSDVTCSSSTDCVTVGAGAFETANDGGTWVADTVEGNSDGLEAISCGEPGSCIATHTNLLQLYVQDGVEASFVPSSLVLPATVASLQATCVSGTLTCYVVVNYGAGSGTDQEVLGSADGGLDWTNITPSDMPGGSELFVTGLQCPTVSECVLLAVDYATSNNAFLTTTDGWQTVGINEPPGIDSLGSLSCSTASLCVAWGGSSYALGDPLTGPGGTWQVTASNYPYPAPAGTQISNVVCTSYVTCLVTGSNYICTDNDGCNASDFAAFGLTGPPVVLPASDGSPSAIACTPTVCFMSTSTGLYEGPAMPSPTAVDGSLPGADQSSGGSGSEGSAGCGCQSSDGIGNEPAGGDPVNTATGAYYTTATDLGAGGGGPPLSFTRTYDSGVAQVEASAGDAPPPLGYGWSYNLGMRVDVDDSAGTTTATVTEENGAQVTFDQMPDSKGWCQGLATNFCATAPRIAATLNENLDGSGNVSSWTFTRFVGGTTTFSFDSTGALDSVVDGAGSLTRVAYSACPSGDTCVAWQSSSGRELVIATDSGGRITEVFNPAVSSQIASFGYSGSGCSSFSSGESPDLCSVSDPGSQTSTYAYSGSAASSTSQAYELTDATPPGASAPFQNAYDAEGQVAEQHDPNGQVTEFTYMGNATSATGPGGVTEVTTYPDGTGSTPSVTDYSYFQGVMWTTVVGPGSVDPSVTSVAPDPHSLAASSVSDGAGDTTTNQFATYGTSGATDLSSSDLTLSTDPDGNTTQAAYNADNQPWCEVQPAEYAHGVRCGSISEPTAPPNAGSGASSILLGATLTYYDSAGNQVAVTDPLGYTSVTAHTTSGNTGVPPDLAYCTVDAENYSVGDRATDQPVTCPVYGSSAPGATTYTFDSSGDVLTETNPASGTTSYSYGDSSFPWLATTVTSPDGTVTANTYDATGRLTEQVTSFGAYSATSITGYDSLGRRYCTIAPLAYSQGHTACPTPSSTVAPTNSTSDPWPGLSITIYDADNRPIYAVNPLGGVTETAYDASGRVFCSVSPSDYGADVNSGSAAFCPSNPPSSPATSSSDPDLGMTITTYDPAGRAVQVTNPLGGITLTSYDLAGNVAQTTVISNASPTEITTYTHNGDDQVTSTWNGAGTSEQSYDPDGNAYCSVSADAAAGGGYQCPPWQTAWIASPPSPSSLYAAHPSSAQANNVTTSFDNAAGDQVQTTNPDVGTTVTTYDADGRSSCSAGASNVAAWLTAHPAATYPYLCPTPALTSPPAAGSDPGYSTTLYDASGNQSSVTDDLGDTTTDTHDDGGRLLTTTKPLGGVTTNCYYDQSTSCATSAPVGGGSGSDLYSTTTASGATTHYTYFPGGATDATTTPAGTTTDSYDASGDLSGVAYSSGTPTSVSDVYNSDGTRQSMTDQTGTTADWYDALGDLTEQQFSPASGSGLSAETTTYGYSDTGVPAWTEYPSNALTAGIQPTVYYGYNAEGEETSLTDWLGNTTYFGYDGDGNLMTTTYPNGDTVTSTPDPSDFPKSTSLSGHATASITYSPNPAGLDAAQTDSGALTATDGGAALSGSGSGTTATVSNAYTQANQLSASTPSSFGYDADGNPTSFTNGVSQSFNTADQLTSATNGGDVTSFGYDGAGDRSSENPTVGSQVTYGYNQASQLTSVTSVRAALGEIASNDTSTVFAQPGGEVYTVGVNTYGQLGDGNTTWSNAPVVVDELSSSNPPPALTGVVQIAAAETESAAVDGNGGLWVWGDNTYNELDRSTSPLTYSTEAGQVTVAGVTFKQVALGNGFVIALSTAGNLYSWGLDSNGQLGRGSSASQPETPTEISGLSNVTQIAVGTNFTLALTASGSVYAWGRNQAGQIAQGSGGSANYWTPTLVTLAPQSSSPPVKASFVAADSQTAIVVTAGGEVQTWGTNTDGQLGNGQSGSGTHSSSPGLVPVASGSVPLSGIVTVAESNNDSIALSASGQVYSWGDDSFGELGDGTTSSTLSLFPVLVQQGATAIGAGGGTAYELMPSGAVYGWGADEDGQLGDNARQNVASPMDISNVVGDKGVYGAGKTVSALTAVTYNADGLRSSMQGAYGSSQFTWDTRAGVPQLLSDGSNDYLYGPNGLPLEQVTAGGIDFYFHDRMGSTRALVNSSGGMVATFSYDAYGGLSGESGTVTTPLLYAGGLYDAPTGLYYLVHRYYDPGTGAFLTVDPLVSQTGQAYEYAGGDPVNRGDPSGLAPPPSACLKYVRPFVPGNPPNTALENCVENAIGTGPGEASGPSGWDICRQSYSWWTCAVMLGDPLSPAASQFVDAYEESQDPCAGDWAIFGHLGAGIGLTAPFVLPVFGAAEGGASDLAAAWRGTNMTDDESFEYHYQVHGDGVTPEQYAQDARAWASHPTGTGTPVELADGTWGMRYRTPGGGPGGILDSSGNIITFWYR